MKTGKLTVRILTAVIILAVAAYFGVNLVMYFTDPYALSAVYDFTGENAITVSGYVVRDELILPGGGALTYSDRAEGERVSAGGTVALTYESEAAYENAVELRSLQERLEQVDYARSLAESARSDLGLDEDISAALVDFRAGMASGDTDGLGEDAQALRAAVLRRFYAYSGSESLDVSASSLQEQIDALSASVSGAVRIAAPEAGVFSGYTDGYESVLSLSSAGALTPDAYRALSPGEVPDSVGKLITGDTWGFVTMVRPDDLNGLTVGESVTVRFQKGLDRDMSMTLSYVSAEEDGQVVALFTATKYLSLTTLLRQQNVQLVFEQFEGLRVPRSAVRVTNMPVTGEDGEPVYYESGNQQTENVTGVFCLWGSTARFKPVEIVWQEDEYILVRPADGASEGRTLRVGDQVITTAEDLFDGKVIQ